MRAAGRRSAILGCLAFALLCPAAALAARPLALGFDDEVFTGPNAATWFHRSVQAGADLVRIVISWRGVAPAHRPAGFDARNPADPAYNFSTADAAIRLANQEGLSVLLQFTGAPQWAEGAGAPAGAPPGTWRPDPGAIEDYGIALGQRYSGHFPDPLHPGQMLPRVAAFQVWNEPNLSVYLTPQWSGRRMESPVIYRQMLNAFYAGVKSVDPSALVVTAGTAPFGDPFVGGMRIPPVPFWRDLLCLRQVGGGLTGTNCPDPAHFDVLAHHPYSVGSPDTKALNPGDVTIPDMGKLTRLLRAAERTGRALPRIRHAVWVTEVGYNTRPPNPGGISLALDTRWIAQTLEILWSEGVSAVCWSQLADQAPNPNYASANETGAYFLDGRPKPGPLRAFRLPLVATRGPGRSTVQVWGRVPVAGRVAIEERRGSAWKTVRALGESAGSTFLVTVTARGAVSFRAQIGGDTSLVSHVA